MSNFCIETDKPTLHDSCFNTNAGSTTILSVSRLSMYVYGYSILARSRTVILSHAQDFKGRRNCFQRQKYLVRSQEYLPKDEATMLHQF